MPDMTGQDGVERKINVYGACGKPLGVFTLNLDDPDPFSRTLYIDVHGREFPVIPIGNGSYRLLRPRHTRKVVHYAGI